MRLYTCKRTEKSRPFSLFFLSPLVLFALSKFFMEEFQKRRYLGFLNFEAKEENFLFVLPSIHFVHITVRSLRIIIKENKTTRREEKWRKQNHESGAKRNLLLPRALEFSRTSWFHWSRERVFGGIVGERAIEISRGKKAEL